MANANVLELMAQYDFTSPINITLLFEDSDDDLEIMDENEQSIYSDTDNNVRDNMASKEKGETEGLQIETNTDKQSKVSNESLLLNVSVKELRNDKPSVENKQSKGNELEKNSHCGAEKTSNILNEPYQHSIPPDLSHEYHSNVMSEALSETRLAQEYITNHNYSKTASQKPVTYIDGLLITVSEHIILIMHAYYRYRIHVNTCDPLPSLAYHKREKVYTLIKHHFFELSYQTMISIVVPQEQNATFINIFLENTVRIANSRSKRWVYHRRHFEPFLNEMLAWTKNKRCLIKQISLHLSPDENYHLKQRLSKPLQPMNQQFSETPSSQRENISNNVCIFTSGSSGVEINVNPDTLINCNNKQYSHAIWHEVQNYNPLNNSYQTGSESLIKPQVCENKTLNHTKNYNRKHQRRLNPYGIQNSTNKQSQETVCQSSQNIELPLHETQTRRQHENIEIRLTQCQTNNEPRSTSPSNPGIQNAVNDGNNQMLRLHTQTTNEACANQVPVISNVISLNSTAEQSIEGRCCVCGKRTHITCSKCNNPSYCSYLCQELDKQCNNSKRTLC